MNQSIQKAPGTTFFYRSAALIVCAMLAACAPNPEKVQRIADEEAERLSPPNRPLSSFANFELQPLQMHEAIEQDDDKREEAQEFETNLRARIDPLLQQWNASDTGGQGTLLVEPVLLKLRIVGGEARFFGGVFTGGSFIDLDLNLIDGDSGEMVGTTRVYRSAGALAGAYSIGKSDQNLDEYIVSIIHEYLSDSY